MAEDKRKQIDEDVDVITLEFEDGADIECEVMGIFEYEGNEYIALIPLDDSDDVYIYGYKEVSEEEFELVDIDSDELFAQVVQEFDAIMAEEE